MGAYIAQMTEAGDYPRIALGVAIMSVLVIASEPAALAAALRLRRTPDPARLREAMNDLRKIPRSSSFGKVCKTFAKPSGEPLPVLVDIDVSLARG